MRTRWWGLGMGIVGALVFAAGLEAAPPKKPRFDGVTLAIRHRVFHDFRDEQKVRLNQDFMLGDTDYTARVIQYVPDFMMDLESRRVISRSDQPNNPAFRIVVRKNKVPQDTTWALFRMPPHFARKSFFGFQVVRLDFMDRPPVIADTSITSKPSVVPREAVVSPHPKHAVPDTVRRK